MIGDSYLDFGVRVFLFGESGDPVDFRFRRFACLRAVREAPRLHLWGLTCPFFPAGVCAPFTAINLGIALTGGLGFGFYQKWFWVIRFVLLGLGRGCFWNVTYFEEKQGEITRFGGPLGGFGQFAQVFGQFPRFSAGGSDI